MFAYISLPIYNFQNFIYKIPLSLQSQIYPGTCVNIKFRNKLNKGYVTKVSLKCNFKGKILPIDSISSSNLSIPLELWKTLEWVSDYYISPFGQVIKSSIPYNFNYHYKSYNIDYVKINQKGLKLYDNWNKRAPIQKKILSLLKKEHPNVIQLSELSKIGTSYRSVCKKLIDDGYIDIVTKKNNPFSQYIFTKKTKIKLNKEQNGVFKNILKDINKDIFSPYYLKGVTGSGKTEVYLKLAEECVNQKKSVIILVPEIALTPNVFQKFYNIFKDKVALWHSGLTKLEKGWVWQQLRKRKISVIVGARSAIFLPMENLGMVVVDEEQESSYKQESPSPRYNARDIALVRSKFSNSIALLTSATPSLESYYNCINKKLKYVELTKRYGKSIYPNIKLINMRLNYNDRINFSQHLSRELVTKVNQCINDGEQVILLHNRRGYAYIQICKNCEWIFQCPNCTVSLTYHKSGNTMLCHHCNFKSPMKIKCLECGQDDLEILGHGTQKIEDEISKMLPLAKIARLDIDSSKNKGAHFKILKKFEKQEYNILLGTQMIAKGLDFENVTFVGIINADVGLFLPDFRSGEKIFQLIYQVSGRAGRRQKQGLVYIQTYNPDDIFIKTASQLDLKSFYKISLNQRKELFYPPFNRICRILFQGKNKNNTLKIAEELSEKFENNKFNVLGPSIAPIEKIKGMWRYHLLIKINLNKPYELQKFLKEKIGLDFLQKQIKGTKIIIDIDPISMI